MMLMPGVAGCTLNSAPAARYCHFERGAVTGASRLRDINREVVLYADQ